MVWRTCTSKYWLPLCAALVPSFGGVLMVTLSDEIGENVTVQAVRLDAQPAALVTVLLA